MYPSFFDEMHKIADAAQAAPAPNPVLDKMKARAGEMGVPIRTFMDMFTDFEDNLTEEGKNLDEKGRQEAATQMERDLTAFYHPDKHSVYLGENIDPAILAHELGHADQKGSLIQNRVARELHNSSAPVGALTGVGLAALRGSDMSHPAVNVAGAALPVVMGAPTMANEAIASFKGYKMLQDAGASADELKGARKRLRKAFGTYTVEPLAGTVLSTAGAVVPKSLLQS
jgi:hypothetical protein